jgi:hypothetical protein
MLKVAVPVSLGEFMDKKDAAPEQDAVMAVAQAAH